MSVDFKTVPEHFVDAHAKRVRDQINFHSHQLQVSDMTLAEIEQLLSIPQVDSGCIVKTHPNKSGSAFAQMTEYGIVAGFMRGHDTSIRVLVVLTERPNDDGSYDYAFFPIKQIKHLKKGV
jgi:hypothetical protein